MSLQLDETVYAYALDTNGKLVMQAETTADAYAADGVSFTNTTGETVYVNEVILRGAIRGEQRFVVQPLLRKDMLTLTEPKRTLF